MNCQENSGVRFARTRFEITRLNEFLNLKDGIKIIGAAKPPNSHDREIVLYLTGDSLPPEGEGPATYVSVEEILSASEALQATSQDEPITA